MLRNFAACGLLVLLVATGCDCQSKSLNAELSAERDRLQLAAEPPGAVSVLELRESLTGNSQDVVVVGRVGGSKPVFSAQHASFFLVDPAALPEHQHADGCGDNCPYCSKGADDNAVAMIHCVDAQGEAVPIGADRLFDLAEGQTAVIQGTAHVDESGNLIVLANGLYIRR